MGNLSSEQVLNKVDEYQSIQVKDRIILGDVVEYIHHTSLDRLTNQKLISFMRGDELISIDRNEYVLKGWAKGFD